MSQVEDEQVCGENGYRCEECTHCARTKPCECGCGLLGGTCRKGRAKREAERIVECFYICKHCKAFDNNSEEGNIDCLECGNTDCIHLYQAETPEKALEMANKGLRLWTYGR